MRMKAQNELKKRSPQEEETISKKKDKEPSFASGFWLILLGSTTMVIFFSIGQILIGILAGAAFTFIGSIRISKASARRTHKMVQSRKQT
jgi:hypothetical protein